MTEHDPRPSDDELRAWRDEANEDDPFLGPHQLLKGKLADACDALLSERAAHLATKAALTNLVQAGEAFSMTPDVKAIGWDVSGAWILALQSARALADPEEPQTGEKVNENR